MSIQEVLTECTRAEDWVLFADSQAVSVHHGAECRMSQHLGPLKLHDVYSQKYLLGHGFMDSTTGPETY